MNKNPREIAKSDLSKTNRPKSERILTTENGEQIKLKGGTIEALGLAKSIGYFVMFDNILIEKKALKLFQINNKFYLDVENYTTFTLKLNEIHSRQIYDGYLIRANFTTKI